MFQSLNSNSQLVEFTQIFIKNLKYGKKKSDVGFSLDMKTDYGNALEEFLINASRQMKKNALDNAFVFELVQDFFDNFTSSDSWMEQIDTNIKDELKKQKQLNKKVG